MGRLDQTRLVGMTDLQIRNVLSDIIMELDSIKALLNSLDYNHHSLAGTVHHMNHDIDELQHFQRSIDNIKARSLVLFDELMMEDEYK